MAMTSPVTVRSSPTAGDSPGPKRPPKREIAPSPPAASTTMSSDKITHVLQQLMAQGSMDMVWSTRVNESIEDMATKMGIEKKKTTVLHAQLAEAKSEINDLKFTLRMSSAMLSGTTLPTRMPLISTTSRSRRPWRRTTASLRRPLSKMTRT